MEVRLRPETNPAFRNLPKRLDGAADELVEDAMAGYLFELAQTREMLDARYDELKNGSIMAINGEDAFKALRRRSEQRRRS